MIGFICDVRW